jgi:hypothetical protein
MRYNVFKDSLLIGKDAGVIGETKRWDHPHPAHCIRRPLPRRAGEV